jgi:CubicO group peptidase (beta-lactamase class C family)
MPFAAFVRSIPTVVLLLGAGTAQVVTSYHDVSSATHQTNFNNLSNQGYRLVSLAVAGSLSSPRYSAVWEQVAGPGWVSSHDMSSTQYAAAKANWENQGFRAKIVSVAGTTTGTRVYAAVFVADAVDHYDSSAISEAGLASVMTTQRNANRYPVSIDMYGSVAAGYWFAAVFEANTGDVAWGYNVDADSSEFGETRTAHGEPDHRLACIGMSEDLRYVSVWYDQRVGVETIASNQTTTGWGNLTTVVTGNGHYPRMIGAGGTGTAARFAGSFAEYRTPRVRQWTLQGSSSSSFASIDAYVQSIMQNERHRAAAVAITRDGKLVHARSFNLTEAGNPIVYPDSSFRIGSCSKPVAAFAAHEADEQNYLTMSTAPATALGLAYPLGSSFPNVSIRSILRFTSGIQRNYTPTDVAEWLNPTSPQYPVSLAAAADWLAMQPMLFNPYGLPTYAEYSNAAYLLVGEVIRVRTGMSYWTFVQNEVLSPLGITRMHVAPSEYSQLTANDVRHHMAELTVEPSERYTDRRRRCSLYAEDLYFKRASGGLSASVVDYVRLLAGAFDLQGADSVLFLTPTRDDLLQTLSYPKFSNPAETSTVCTAGMAWSSRPGGVTAYSKGGWLPSNATADVCWRDDGIAWAVFFNSPRSGASTDEMNNRIEAITSWPNVDLFPSYGLPAFPQRPRIEAVTPASRNNVTSGYFTLTGKRFDTATHVNFGFSQITSSSPNDWGNGYFTVLSPTSMRVHPPQGRAPGTYALAVANAVGASPAVNVDLTANPTFFLGAPAQVGGQPFAVWIARGTTSGITQPTGFGILCLSFSNQPSAVPGIVSLGLGNGFTDFLTSGAFQFSATTSAYRFDLPPLPSGTVYLEAVGFDLTWPSVFPLLSTNTTATTRQ